MGVGKGLAYFGFISFFMIKKLFDHIMGRRKNDDSNRSGSGLNQVDTHIKKSFLKKNGRELDKKFGTQRIISLKEHKIDLQNVDERAIDVVETLQSKGYKAYIVGGAVRDLLLGIKPKDFDVATNATPEQVKSLFRRAFIIGRRFRIVHVVFGRGREHEVVEVSTFRAFLDSAQAHQVTGNEKSGKKELAGVSHAVDESGRVLRDNVWGPIEEDATRRDFTVNAMYYDPLTQEVIDFHGGFEDSKKRVIKMIGDPGLRYREDPVRIIRAIRFVAKLSKLGFKLEKQTAKPLKSMVNLLEDVPPSRLFDETLKLLQTGHAIASIEQLKILDLEIGIYPILDLVVQRSDQPMVKVALEDTDRRVGEGKPVVPSFLLSCLLWTDVLDRWQAFSANTASFPALQEAIDRVFDSRIGDVSGRGKLAADMREIWSMQTRFDKQTGRAPLSLVEQPRFRAAFDFLRLRAKVGEIPTELADWWDTFSTSYPDERELMIEDKREELLRNQRSQKNPIKTRQTPRSSLPILGDAGEHSSIKNSIASGLSNEGPGSDEGAEQSRPKRRRRRRSNSATNAATPPSPTSNES